MTEFKPDYPLVTHWDGKLLLESFGLRNVERLPVYVSGNGTEKLLVAPKFSGGGTGQNIAKSVFTLIRQWSVEEKNSSLANYWASVSTLRINKSWKNLLPNFIDSEIEENVQTEEIQLASLINQLQNTNPMSNTEDLQWAAEADGSLARNKILTDDEIIRTVTAAEDDDEDERHPL
ncbi:hypothetical protein AVEN_203689-1 [Araneus ventricosus]|uniref:Uncharacterized protein n=1 Tax=Araneus ventricosus TaxID=182803 RepID=A0A4Y2EZH0_ARAVE|nr:hypothetical protein AVEN_203689-1 [Araneus ventricosus]